ncbi:relaxase/mobilization nuclease domain-containing protein [Amycolatopsis lurida]
MIAKVVAGWRPGGLVAYLMGPGEFEEHRSPRVVASWDGAPELHQPAKTGPGEFDFDLRVLIGVMSELPKELGLPSNTPPPKPDGLPGAEEWLRWLRCAGKRRPPALAPDWVRYYRYDEKLDQVELKPGYVWHCPVRLHSDDPVFSDDRWRYIAQGLMEATGIHQTGARWIAVRHADDHIHLMATLVTAQGGKLRRIYPRNDWVQLRKMCRQLEAELGITPTPDIYWTARRHPTRSEFGKAERAGRAEPARAELHRLVAQAAAAASGPQEFFEKLDWFGVRYEVRRNAVGQICGCRFALPADRAADGRPVWFGGGRLATDLTWPKLLVRWESTPAVEPQEGTREGRSTPKGRCEALNETTSAVQNAITAVRLREEDPDGIAHAAGEVLGVLARGVEHPNPGAISAAMDHYDRAMRTPVRGLPADIGHLARELRRASRRLASVGMLTARGGERTALAALVLALAGLFTEIGSALTACGRGHQAAAARLASATLPVDRGAALRVERRSGAPTHERSARTGSSPGARRLSHYSDRAPRRRR